jgi:flagellar hook-length control protein FliK
LVSINNKLITTYNKMNQVLLDTKIQANPTNRNPDFSRSNSENNFSDEMKRQTPKSKPSWACDKSKDTKPSTPHEKPETNSTTKEKLSIEAKTEDKKSTPAQPTNSTAEVAEVAEVAEATVIDPENVIYKDLETPPGEKSQWEDSVVVADEVSTKAKDNLVADVKSGSPATTMNTSKDGQDVGKTIITPEKVEADIPDTESTTQTKRPDPSGIQGERIRQQAQVASTPTAMTTQQIASTEKVSSVNNQSKVLPTVTANSTLLTSDVAKELDGTQKKLITERTHVLDKKWAASLSSKIAVGINASATNITAKINPANMGPIEIQIQKTEDSINVSMLVTSSATKEILDANANKIIKGLTDSGVEVGDFDINHHNQDENQKNENQSNLSKKISSMEESFSEDLAVSINDKKESQGIIDSYA